MRRLKCANRRNNRKSGDIVINGLASRTDRPITLAGAYVQQNRTGCYLLAANGSSTGPGLKICLGDRQDNKSAHAAAQLDLRTSGLRDDAYPYVDLTITVPGCQSAADFVAISSEIK